MTTTKNLKLFTPTELGALKLKHRVVMAPLTRSRSDQPGGIPGDKLIQHFSDRASDGGLLITEATNISSTARGWYGAPGLYSDQQVAGWRKVAAGVHAKGGLIVAQLWHTGRSSNVDNQDGGTPVSASVNPSYWQDPNNLVSTPTGWAQPSPHRALEIAEIAGIVADYGKAAQRAKDAGFDGVEIHGGNGYLLDQFLQDNSNKRTDEYGGAIENRARLLLEVTSGVVKVWGDGRVGIRIAPAGTWNDMADSNPNALFCYVAEQLNRAHLAYLHVVEPRVKGNTVIAEGQGAVASERLRKIYTGKILAAGGFEPDTAEAVLEAGDADAVAFGRHFVANPDLPRRIQEGIALAKHDRDTFYTFDPVGYNDYPSASAV